MMKLRRALWSSVSTIHDDTLQYYYVQVLNVHFSTQDTYELSPFCSEATLLLENCGIKYREISLGKEWVPGLISDATKRAALLEITGQSSLPNIFIGGASIGGLFSGSPGLVPALEQGKLMSMIDDAKKSM